MNEDEINQSLEYEEWVKQNYRDFRTKAKREEIITVTRSFLPSKTKYLSYLSKIWKNGWLTNGGPNVIELESKLQTFFKVKHISLINNGTTALQIALKSLDLKKGEIITTPFSYVATVSSIVWEGFAPVFVDIKPDTLTMDPKKIEAAITSKTRAILPVHVYGIPCDVEAIAAIPKKHELKVIYDAAHAFGVNHEGKSLVSYGDISVLSFHATKLFHTIEGGAIVTQNDEIAHRAAYLKNFGHDTPTSFHGVGINGKMNEFSAAMGLATLDYVPVLISKREKIFSWYDAFLKSKLITRPHRPTVSEYNYSYYPVLFDSEDVLLKILDLLEESKIIARRYFYPSLNTLNYVKYRTCPISEDVSRRVLCLPLYPGLQKNQINLICKIILKGIKP